MSWIVVSPARSGTGTAGSSSPVTAVQRRSRCSAASATIGPRSREPASCQPSRPRAGCCDVSQRSPPRSVRSTPPTNATSSSTTTTFSWWQCRRRSCASMATRTPVPRESSRASARTAARAGVKARNGAPAQSRTRTSTPRATAWASSSRSTVGGSPRSSAKCGATCQPAMRTVRRAPRIASAIAGSTSAPSMSTSIEQPSRGGGASRHHGEPSSGGSSASSRPRRRRRYRWCATMARSIAPPRKRSAAAIGSTDAVSRCRLQQRAQRRRGAVDAV